ncbi:hypothetical protein D3C74_316840 [compost metagenome]
MDRLFLFPSQAETTENLVRFVHSKTYEGYDCSQERQFFCSLLHVTVLELVCIRFVYAVRQTPVQLNQANPCLM